MFVCLFIVLVSFWQKILATILLELVIRVPFKMNAFKLKKKKGTKMGRGVDDKNIISKASAKKHEREM